MCECEIEREREEKESMWKTKGEEGVRKVRFGWGEIRGQSEPVAPHRQSPAPKSVTSDLQSELPGSSSVSAPAVSVTYTLVCRSPNKTDSGTGQLFRVLLHIIMLQSESSQIYSPLAQLSKSCHDRITSRQTSLLFAISLNFITEWPLNELKDSRYVLDYPLSFCGSVLTYQTVLC